MLRTRIEQYLKENWGAPFIVAFMAILVACACLLASGNEGLANELAVYAYYSLVIGVALQLASFIREERRKRGPHVGESHPQ
jgi:hypothetical protein